MSGRLAALALVALAAGCGVDQLGAASRRVASTRQAIVGGRVTFGDPEVFALNIVEGNDTFLCSSTLIGPHTLLTAAHCVYPDTGTPPEVSANNAASIYGTPPSADIPATATYYNQGYDAKRIVNDTGIVQLSREPFAPTKPINRAPLDSYLGAQIRVTGFGITSSGEEDYGSKRTTTTKIRLVEPALFRLGTGSHGICQGDSGGPGMLTFADGVERQIGITSFGSNVCGSDLDTDVRVDRYLDFIDGYLDQFEGRCEADGRCRPGCVPADPDCACFEDGVCDSSCANPAIDPDCASSCGADGVCSRTACASPDPDCAGFGAACGRDGHCAGRACITSPQHDAPYCSQPCDAASACPSGFECSSGVCRYPLRPEAALGALCTPGATWCGSDGVACALYDGGTHERCVTRCFEDADCTNGESCSVSLGAGPEGVCATRVALTHLGTEHWPAAKGCGVAPEGTLGLLGLLWLVRRRGSAGRVMRTRR